MIYGDDVIIFLSDANSMRLANRTVLINIERDVFNLITDDNGFVNLSSMNAGKYNITATFEGDEVYDGTELKFNIEIGKMNTTLACKNLSTSVVIVKVDGKSGPYFTATLANSNGSLLVNRSIQITLNNKVYNAVTDESGASKLQINIAKSGTYTASVEFLGDINYKDSAATAKIIIKKKKLKLTVGKKTYKSTAKTKKLTATLKNSENKAISGKKVTFKVNGKKYSAKTNKKGIATVKIKITKKKTYAVKAIFSGDNSYFKVTKTSKIIIK
jgi:hypothetical protein